MCSIGYLERDLVGDCIKCNYNCYTCDSNDTASCTACFGSQRDNDIPDW